MFQSLIKTNNMSVKKSKVKGTGGYTFYDIPNVDNVKISIHECDDIDLVGRCDPRGYWFRLGDRPDLKPEVLKDFRVWCERDRTKAEKEAYIKKVIEIFA